MPYHQKYTLRRHHEIMQELVALFPDEAALLGSTMAARLNGVLDGFGDPAQLPAELTNPVLPAPVAQQLAELAHKRLNDRNKAQ